MISDKLQVSQPLYKSCCRHWFLLPKKIILPPLKQNLYWICIQNPDIIIKSPSPKQSLASAVKYYKPSANLFISKQNLMIYCVVCEKEIYDIHQHYSTEKDKDALSPNFVNPLKIRQYYAKPINQDSMFLSNLQFPESFVKEKRNCAIFVSQNGNSFLSSALRFLAFIPTFSSIVCQIDTQKVKSPTLKSTFYLIKSMSQGKYRVLKTKDFQNNIFRQFEQFISYQKRSPILVIMELLKLIEIQFGWKDVKAVPKTKLKQQRSQWDFNKKCIRYSPVKQMINSTAIRQCQCLKCGICKVVEQKSFQCLSLSLSLTLSPSLLSNKRVIQLNPLKAMSQTFQSQFQNLSFQNQFIQCQCNYKTKRSIIIQPGNHLIFQIQTNNEIKTILPKTFNLKDLQQKNCYIKEQNCIFDFIAGIYKSDDDKLYNSTQYGTVVYHIQNKKYLTFLDNNIHQSENLNGEKKFCFVIYRRRPDQKLASIVKNIKSTIYLADQGQLDIENTVPLPDFFDVYLTHHYKIPLLLNPYICHHGNTIPKHKSLSKVKKVNTIPVEVYNYLVDQFGGRIINNQLLEQCQQCIQQLKSLNQLKQNQRQLIKYVDKLSTKKDRVLIYKSWLQAWKAYLYQKSSENYTVWGNPPPLSIDNYKGMINNNIKTIDNSQYGKVSIEVWHALLAFHGGGPQISKKKVSPSLMARNYVNLKLSDAKNLNKDFLQCASEQIFNFISQKNQDKLTIAQQTNADYSDTEG